MERSRTRHECKACAVNEIAIVSTLYKFPSTLNALWKDHKTGIGGIEKYHYSHHDTTYNLFFEQPKFMLDQIGTRERTTQGWYASFETGIPHWKYFWFD